MSPTAADQTTNVDLALAVSGATLTPWQVHNLHLFLQAFGEDAALRYLEDLRLSDLITNAELALSDLITNAIRVELSRPGRVA